MFIKTEHDKENACILIGCPMETLNMILQKAVGNVSVSGGSYYADWWMLDSGSGVLARFDWRGNLKEYR